MKNFAIIALTIIVVGLIVYTATLGIEKDEVAETENFLLSHWALSADNHLTLAKNAVEKKSYSSGLYEIEKAVGVINSLRPIADTESSDLITKAVSHLTLVQEELKSSQIDPVNLEMASARALNTLALINLRLSDNLAESGKSKDAMKSIRTAIVHLQNAIDVSNSSNIRKAETVVIKELKQLLDSLEKNGHLNNAEYTISANDLVQLITN